MAALNSGSKIRSTIAAVLQRCREWMADGSRAELRYCGEEDLARMAHDAGVTAGEFRSLAKQSPHSADLLLSRMDALGLDRDQIARAEPQVFHDLQRVCSMCIRHGRCARDLKRDSSDQAWQDYCPNVDTLGELTTSPWASHAG